MVILSASYQSSISSEYMALSTFPTFANFLKQGYKIGLPLETEFFLPAINFMMPDHVRRQTKTFFQERDFLDVVSANLSVIRLNKVGFKTFVEEIVENKIIFAAAFHDIYGEGLFTAMERQICLLEKKCICKGFKISQNNPLMLSVSLRIWGCLSKRFFGLYMRWEEMGLLVKLSHMKAVKRLYELTKVVKIETTTEIKQPRKIRLWSPVGFACFLVYLLGCVLLIAAAVRKFINSKYAYILLLIFQIIGSKLRTYKEKCKNSILWLLLRNKYLSAFG